MAITATGTPYTVGSGCCGCSGICPCDGSGVTGYEFTPIGLEAAAVQCTGGRRCSGSAAGDDAPFTTVAFDGSYGPCTAAGFQQVIAAFCERTVSVVLDRRFGTTTLRLTWTIQITGYGDRTIDRTVTLPYAIPCCDEFTVTLPPGSATVSACEVTSTLDIAVHVRPIGCITDDEGDDDDPVDGGRAFFADATDPTADDAGTDASYDAEAMQARPAMQAVPAVPCQFRSDDPHTVKDGTGRQAYTCQKPGFERFGLDVFTCSSCSDPSRRCNGTCPGYEPAAP